MSQYHKWPGAWTRTAPRVEDHCEGAELVWVVRGHPFTRAVVARTSVMVFYPGHDGMVTRAVRVELMADGLHGVDASGYPWFHRLEWRGPMAIPEMDE
jgi:hypothetical protein